MFKGEISPQVQASEQRKPLIEKSGQGWKLAHKPEMGRLVREHPRIFQDALELIAETENLGVAETFERDGMRVTYFQKRNWSNNFKLEIEQQKFFIRKELGRGTGYNSMKSVEEATKRIQGRDDMRLIDYQLGYTDESGNDYLVAGWEDLPVMADYLGQDLSDEERDFIGGKLEYIYETFSDYKDVTTGNMFYDPAKKQVVLFDLEKKQPNEDVEETKQT